MREVALALASRDENETANRSSSVRESVLRANRYPDASIRPPTPPPPPPPPPPPQLVRGNEGRSEDGRESAHRRSLQATRALEPETHILS
uniref:Uncharacterized protein n=1 Tax=Vespula pensylvanica TaxID=30213 RepID=A0A834NRW8_VESPE|nr:hypothetical protein H0235_011289 [Vespula pensylvanica]